MSLEQTIHDAWDKRASLSPAAVPPALREAVDHAIAELNAGRVRVAQKIDGQWITHQWLKMAVLLSFRLSDNRSIRAGDLAFYDKVDLKFSHLDAAHMRDTGVRVVPPAVARRGSFIAKNVVLMPSYVNIAPMSTRHDGGHLGDGHLRPDRQTCTYPAESASAGARASTGEPDDHRGQLLHRRASEVVEGVIVEENAVLGMGVFIGQSTKIFNRETGEISYGRVPAGSVVVAGSLPSRDCNLYCAVIVKQVDAKTRAKTSINELLRA
jgi:2,3,4,5-tetrahydropyridine-2-carboxylate N-succinyltransferase